MIELSNGYKIEFCTGSGALGFDGRGWPWEYPLRWLGILDPKAFTIVAKTVTRDPLRGNLSFLHPWSCVHVLSKTSAVNAVGLTNPGLQDWVKFCYPRAKRMGYHLAASVKPNTPDEAGWMAALLRKCKVPYVEVNLSCPNVHEVKDDIAAMLRCLGNCQHPLILKLSLDQTQEEFIRKTEPLVEAYHAINTVPWNHLCPDIPSPIEKYRHGQQGGLSGEPIRTKALEAVRFLKDVTDRPIIAGGGIFSAEHVDLFEKAGASAFSIGTCFLTQPCRPNQIVRQYRKRV